MAEKKTTRVNWGGETDKDSGFPTGATPAENGAFVLIETTVKDGEKNVPLSYAVPHFDSFISWLSGLPRTADKGMSQEAVYDRFLYATDLKERAAQRENVAAESTTITIQGKPVDLLTLEPKKAVAAVNAAHMWSMTTGKEPQKAAAVARRKMLAEGVGGFKVTEQNGMLVLQGK